MAIRALILTGVPGTQPSWLAFVKVVIQILSAGVWTQAYTAEVPSDSFSGSLSVMDHCFLLASISSVFYSIVMSVEIAAPWRFPRAFALFGYVCGVVFWLAYSIWAAVVSQAFSFRRKGDQEVIEQETAPIAELGITIFFVSLFHTAVFVKACLEDHQTPAQQYQLEELRRVDRRPEDGVAAPLPSHNPQRRDTPQ